MKTTKNSKEKSYKKKKNINQKKNFVLKVFTYCFVWVVLLLTMFFSNGIENILNVTKFDFSSAVASGDYRVHFIDVGQGDCILIELPDEKTALIDSGPSSSKNDLLKYFNALELDTIDYFIITHTDSDHIGNALTIFETYDVLNVYVPKLYSNYEVENGYDTENYNVVETTIWSNVSQAIYLESCLQTKTYNFFEESISGEGYSFHFYSPFEDVISSVNDYSPIIMLTIKGNKYIFTGDATTEVEEDFLNNYAEMVENGFFDCDVLKVGHHGSTTSTSISFLEAIDAETAVISVGAKNSYSHPRDEILNRLYENGSEILRTDTMGSIVMTTSNGEILSQTGYNNLSDVYLEWESFVIGGGAILVSFAFVLFKKQHKKS